MRTLIEFYDADITTSMISVLTFRPDKVVYLYDKRLVKKADVHHLFKGCQAHLPELYMEKYLVETSDIFAIEEILRKVICECEDCSIDLTGGPDLMVVAGYKMGMEYALPLLHVDMQRKQMINLQNPEAAGLPLASLTLEDYIFVTGAYLLGYSKKAPEPDLYGKVLSMCHLVFFHLQEWKETCLYLQTVMAKRAGLEFHGAPYITLKNGQKMSPSAKLLEGAVRYGFIEELQIPGDGVHFRFVSQDTKESMLTYGSWLELFTYIHVNEIEGFGGARLGMSLDWNAYDGVEILGNEIDVTFIKDSIPIFISCKLTEPDADAIHELMVIRNRLGGKYGKGVLVSFSDMKRQNTPMNRKARELDILVLDKNDILAPDFRNRFRNLILEALPFGGR